MPPPKSAKLMNEDQPRFEEAVNVNAVIEPQQGPVKIKRIQCCNDYVAILQSRIQSTIELPNQQYKNEGIIVGIGPGVENPVGRPSNGLMIGQVVMFYGNPMATLNAKGFYANQPILIINERSILCKLPCVDVEIVEPTE